MVNIVGAAVILLFLIISIWTMQQAKYYMEVKRMVE